MAANTTPIYPAAPAAWHCKLSVANPNRDGTGTIVELAAGGTNGARVDRVEIKPTGTTHGGLVRLWLKDGSDYNLLDELPVSAATASALTRTSRTEYVRTDGEPVVLLGASQQLCVSTQAADAFDVTAFGGTY